MRNPKLEQLLAEIIAEYVKTAEPVGSLQLAEQSAAGVSSATIRNHMAELEELGYVFQPHTSSGRVPTVKGYEWQVSRLEASVPVAPAYAKPFAKAAGAESEPIMAVKSVAKQLAEATQAAAIVAWSPRDYFYTGLSHLFRQPEFVQPQVVYGLSRIIDHFDRVLDQLFRQLPSDPITIQLGRQNPFGEHCAMLFTRVTVPSGSGMLGVVGPLRMDYQRNHDLLRAAKAVIQSNSSMI